MTMTEHLEANPLRDPYELEDIVAALNGEQYTLCVGTDSVAIMRVSSEPAPDALSWLKLWPPDDAPLTGVIVGKFGFKTPLPATIIEVENPRLTFARLATKLFPPYGYTRYGPVDYAARDAGFGFVRNPAGELELFPHYGAVRVGKNVEVGHFVCIDPGALTDTIIEDGVKIDNLCHIAHGAHIGAHTSIAALSCIEGSVKIGKRCTIGSGVTFQIGSGCGDDVTVGSGSVVTKFIPAGQTWLGNPARQWK